MTNDTKPLLPQARPSVNQPEASSRQDAPADAPPTYTSGDSVYIPGALVGATGRNYGAVDNVNGNRSVPRATSVSNPFRRAKYFLQEKWNRHRFPIVAALFFATMVAAVVGFGYLAYLEENKRTCSLPKDTEMRSSTSAFPSSKDLNFILHVQEGVYGNILVKESDDWAQRNITVLISSGSRLPNLLDTIAHDVRVNALARTAEIFVHLGTKDPKDKKKLLDNNCFRTNIEIRYPRSSSSSSSTGAGRLEAQVANGEIAMDFGNPLSRKPAVFESLGLATTNGDVSLRNVGVLQRTRIRTDRGSVKGSLLSPGAVDVSTCDGSIKLTVHSTALEGGCGQQRQCSLDLMMASKRGQVDLKLSPFFNGHFDLTSASSKPIIEAPNWVYYTTNQTTKIAGWISDNGWEPPYILPRIDLYSGGDQVSVTIGRIFL